MQCCAISGIVKSSRSGRRMVTKSMADIALEDKVLKTQIHVQRSGVFSVVASLVHSPHSTRKILNLFHPKQRRPPRSSEFLSKLTKDLASSEKTLFLAVRTLVVHEKAVRLPVFRLRSERTGGSSRFFIQCFPRTRTPTK